MRRHGTFIALLAALLFATTSASASPSRTAACSWGTVSTRALRGGELDGVAAVSATDIWAVGIRNLTNDDYRPLVVHFDGARWQAVPAPNTGEDSMLSGVAAISSTDVWAMGYRNDRGRTLVEHWDGKSWKVVPSVSPGGDFNLFWGVSAASSTDVWAVGDTATDGPFRPLVEHWDGRAWTVVPAPKSRGGLYGVAALDARNAWAVGGNLNDDELRAVVMHWDGKKWTLLLNSRSDRGLFGIDASSADDVWAVGTMFTRALTTHWGGSALAVGSGARNVMLTGIDATGADEAWAVGLRFGSNDTTRDIVQHWDGRHWSLASPSGRKDGALDDVVAVSPRDVWAAGSLIEHYTCS